MTGHVRGLIRVLSPAPKTRSSPNARWNCLCNRCGHLFTTKGTNLRRETYGLWGCSACYGKWAHPGMKELTTWNNMLRRCFNAKHPTYADYGGRGITVCARWRNSFDHFIEDMGTRPFSRASIGRINNNGNYKPGNCRWESSKQQNRNKRSNRHITFAGKTLTLAEWAEQTGISRVTIVERLNRGWSTRKALTSRLATRPQRVKPNHHTDAPSGSDARSLLDWRGVPSSRSRRGLPGPRHRRWTSAPSLRRDLPAHPGGARPRLPRGSTDDAGPGPTRPEPPDRVQARNAPGLRRLRVARPGRTREATPRRIEGRPQAHLRIAPQP